MITVFGYKAKKVLTAILITTMVIAFLGLSPGNIAYAVTNIYVADYGAIPNDSNDDGNAIRAAIDDAAALGDTNINFSSGIYRISPPPTKWEFNTAGNMEGWAMTNQVSGTVTGGNLNLTVNGNDPYITSVDHLSMGGEYVQQININMKNNTSATQAKIQWITQQDRAWNDAKSVTVSITPNDNGYHSYGFYVKDNTNWSWKTIRQIRIHPVEGVSSGTVDVDYIKIGCNVSDNWDFNQDSNMEGWTMGNQVTGNASSGSLNLTMTGTDHYIYSPVGAHIRNGALTIRMKNNTSATAANLQFITNADSTWDGVKNCSFNISANDADYKEYTIGPGALQEWGGGVSQIRLDLCNGASSGTVNVDYVHWVESSPDYSIFSLRFDYASGLTFNGVIADNQPQTTLLYTDGYSGAMAFNYASNTTFNGLIIDYEQPIFTQGTVTAIDTVNKTIDFQPGTGYSSILDDSRWVTYFKQSYGFTRDKNNPYIMKASGGDAITWKSMTKINSTTWRFGVDDWCAFKLGAPALEVNDNFVITMRGFQAYGCEFCFNNGVTFNTVNMYASPDAGLIAWNNEGSILLSNFQIKRKPGSDRWISTNADGLHFQLSKVGAVMQNSVVQGCADDLLSWYVKPNFIKEVLSSTRIKVYGGWGYNPRQGDKIQIFNPRDGKYIGTANVTSVETVSSYAPSGICILNLDTPISGMTGGSFYDTADAVYDLTYDHPECSITGCTFEDGRRIGAWLKVQDGTVENTTFSNIPAAALDMESDATADYFNDGPPGCSGMQILNNTFNNCHYYRELNQQRPYEAALEILGYRDGLLLAKDQIWKNINISGNTFNHTQASNAIYIGSADIVNITNNTINGYTGDYVFTGQSAGIRIENSTNVTIDNLRISDPRSGLAAGIKIDDLSKNVKIGTYNADLEAAVPSILNTIKASSAYGSVQGPIWTYNQWDGVNYSDMTYNSSGGYWQGSAPFTLINGNSQHPDTGYDSVRSWHAPTSGTVSISAPVTLASTGGNGIVAKVIRDGGSQLWSQTITSTTPVTPTGLDNLSMTQGESIQFLVNNNGNSYNDATLWDPVVTFIGNYDPAAIVTCKASDGFTGTQGRNQWHYETYNGSVYSNMATYNSTGGYWQGAQTYTRITNNGQHPSTGEDSARTWKAPYAALVSIAGNVSVTTGGNGVVVSIIKNTTNLWQTTLSAGGSATPAGVSNIIINAGDVIRFIVNDNGNNAYDSTTWDPVLTVTRQ